MATEKCQCQAQVTKQETAIKKLYYTYSFADNFGPSIPVSDWLILPCGNLIVHENKK